SRRDFVRASALGALLAGAGTMPWWRQLMGLKRPKTKASSRGAGDELPTAQSLASEPKRKSAETDVNPSGLLKVEVGAVATDQAGDQVVLLIDRKEKKILPIWIGPAEAFAIAMALSGKKPLRPLTHDLLNTVIKALDGKVVRVIVVRMKEHTYYANIVLKRGKQVKTIDARPSDSIALALRAKAPIYLTPEVQQFMEPVTPKRRLKRT
ncbi:MAG TPA: bifunctional nuclease family protein, partial [Armatimonadetes bacterium]|nr:bifunctional nuclease family protein [Armatimonadota bacterium]